MFIPQTAQRPDTTPNRRAQDKILYQHSHGDLILKITMIGAMILVFAMAIFTSTAHARADEASAKTASQALSPDVLVSRTTETMLAALKTDRELIDKQPEHLYALANEIVLPHFDLKYMSALALGKHWRRATAEQKARFPAEFRSLLLRTYATALSEYTDEKIEYLPLRGETSDQDVTVHTEIHRSSGPAIPVSYGLHKNNGAWKVYDIKIDGISLVANYRSSFYAQIRRGGMDKLINTLARKNSRIASIK